MSSPKIEIIDYTPENSEAIRTLNYEWLQKWFKLEPGDILTLGNPQGEILDRGGFIFYATKDDEIVGTASLLHREARVFELSKMAVTESAKGMGIGKKLLEHCIAFAQEKNISTLVLYSNTALFTALHLYHKYGFVAVPLEAGIYERANIKMVKEIQQA